jgi:hypothetical protein
MGSAGRLPAWKAILVILGILLAIGVLVYPFMAWRVEQRELECGQSCSKKGFSGYWYSPPEGLRLVRQDKCECVNIK